MRPLMCLSQLTTCSLIMQRGLMKSKPLVSFYGRKILVQSRYGSKNFLKKCNLIHTDIWITPMFKQSKICPVFLYICPESVNHSLFYLSWMCSWSCNLKIGQCSSQWHLYMQQLLCNFRIKRGNHGNYLNALYAIHQ